MRNNACKYTGEEEYRGIPYVVKMDRQKKASRVKKELKEACSTVAFVWLGMLGFMAQVVIPSDAMADLYSAITVGILVLAVIGR